MNTPAFTPGPWFAVNDGTEVHDRETRFDNANGARIGCTPNLVASVDFTGGRGDRAANANLIAAAPELYEALREFVGAVESGTTFADVSVVQGARAALAKAGAA